MLKGFITHSHISEGFITTVFTGVLCHKVICYTTFFCDLRGRWKERKNNQTYIFLPVYLRYNQQISVYVQEEENGGAEDWRNDSKHPDGMND